MPYSRKRLFVLLGYLISLSVALAACASGPTKEEAETLWAESAHADEEARAFTRWNDDDPAEIPTNCAKCHSTTGYHDFLGVDGSIAGQVDEPAPVGTTVECEACHNELSLDKDHAQMPSTVDLSDLGRNSDCMECHQGRASGVQVDEAVNGLPADTVNSEISAPGVHNGPAGPLLYGAQAIGGYEYEGKAYRGRYEHVKEFNTCIACHDAHDLQLDAKQCNACHTEAVDTANIRNIRTSNIDYDGNGSSSEGMSREIESMQQKLLRAIEVYAAQTDEVESIVIGSRFTNEAGDSYTTWTPRLLRAAYNYQFSTLDGGAYVHNPNYTLQLLYDSIEDIGGTTRGMSRPQ